MTKKATNLFLIRHPPVKHADGIVCGCFDAKLVDHWSALSETLINDLKNILTNEELNVPIRIETSTLQRSLTLAKKIHQDLLSFQTDKREDVCDKELCINSDLCEVDFGKWEGLSWNSLPKDELDYWMKDIEKRSPPKGESGIEFRKRVHKALFENETLHKRKVQDRIIITHAGVIRAAISELCDLTLTNSFTFQIDHCSLTKFMFHPDKGWSIQYVNRTLP